MQKPRTWALVSNGVRACILRDLDSGAGEEPLEVVTGARSTHLRDIMADRSGRSFASDHSGRRSAMEPGSDPVRHDMEEFARETFALLERHLRDGHFDRLAMLAAPRMLGVLREQMPSSIAERVVLERAANLMGLAPAEMRAVVAEAVEERRQA